MLDEGGLEHALGHRGTAGESRRPIAMPDASIQQQVLGRDRRPDRLGAARERDC
jgi:hypothetical protein